MTVLTFLFVHDLIRIGELYISATAYALTEREWREGRKEIEFLDL